MQRTYSLASSFSKGSILRCVETCLLLEEDDTQLRLPYQVTCIPEDIGLLIQISDAVASILIGTSLFTLDGYSYEINQHFEVM